MSGVNDDCCVHYNIQQRNTSIMNTSNETFWSTSAQWLTAHSGQFCDKTPGLINNRGRGLGLCNVTQLRIWTARFEKGVMIHSDGKKNTLLNFYHYRVVVYTHWQDTFQFKLHVKVNLASDDPFIKWFHDPFLCPSMLSLFLSVVLVTSAAVVLMTLRRWSWTQVAAVCWTHRGRMRRTAPPSAGTSWWIWAKSVTVGQRK